jgi:hypothetical protein
MAIAVLDKPVSLGEAKATAGAVRASASR